MSWTGDTFKVRLVSSAVTPSRTDTSMTGYTNVGGVDKTITGCTITKDTSLHRIVFDANDPSTFTAPPGGNTVGYVVVFKAGASDALSVPVACSDNANVATNDTDITAPFQSTGVFYRQL